MGGKSEADRVNRDRLRAFRQSLAPHHRPELLAAMVASDGLFGVNPAAAQRTADFTAIFGGDWRMLEARLLRFMAELP